MSIPTTPCLALKDFRYSVDGIQISEAKEGGAVDIPAAIYPGMLEAGMVSPLYAGESIGDAEDLDDADEKLETKAIGAAEENKAHGAAEENKTADAAAFDRMERADLVAYLNERGVSFFKGSDDQKLRDLARLAAGSFHVTKA